jgi:hypothetical protein
MIFHSAARWLAVSGFKEKEYSFTEDCHSIIVSYVSFFCTSVVIIMHSDRVSYIILLIFSAVVWTLVNMVMSLQVEFIDQLTEL